MEVHSCLESEERKWTAMIVGPEYWLALAQLSLQNRPAATDSIRTAAARRPGEPRIAALSLRLDHRDQGRSRLRFALVVRG